MNINNSGITQPCNSNAETAGHTQGNINRMESFSSYCFGTGGGIANSVSAVPLAPSQPRRRSSPMNILSHSQPLRHAFAHARQSLESVKPADRPMAKVWPEGKQNAALQNTMLKVREGVSCSRDYRLYQVQYQGAIFKFCLDENGAATAPTLVHPIASLQRDFTSVAGQPSTAFQKMEGARRILYAYLAEKNKTSPSEPATPTGTVASPPDDFFHFSYPPFP